MLQIIFGLVCSLAVAQGMTPSPPPGSCIGSGDCNGNNCKDCTCVNGKCQCADDWSGPNCMIPFCHNRTDCSNHGDCEASSTSIKCQCDAGYKGGRCETATCKLKCSHGGKCDSSGTKCVGCLGAWSGPRCETWDPSQTTPGALAQRVAQLKIQSQNQLDADKQ
jgi:hypothetical protein